MKKVAIDLSKLSRDYNTFPLVRNEEIPFSDLYYLFFDLNLSRDEVAKIIHTGVSKVRKYLTKYGLKKTFEMQQEKVKRATLEKYGVEFLLQKKEIRDKAVETVKERYGVDNVFKLESIKDKSKKTLIDKYGVDNIQKLPEIRKKSINTLKERYGVSNAMKLHIINKDLWYNDENLTAFVKKGNNGTKWRTIDLAETFNLTTSTVQERIKTLKLWKYINIKSSKEEDEILNLLNSWGLNAEKYRDGHFEIDLYVKNKNIGIEFNGNYWHSTRIRPSINYHKNKSEEALKRGIFLFHIFEYEWNNLRTKQSIINRLRNIFNLNNINIYARNCQIKEVSKKEASLFLNQNHTQGSAPSQIRLGLYYKNEFVALMEFITNSLNKKYQYELSRFCCKAGCNIVGGASKLFKYFLKTYNPKSVISYSDIAKTTGKIYEILGFTLDHISKPQYHWTNGHITLSRYQTQLKQLKKRGWLKEGETRSESDVMTGKNYFKIYDCGKKVWTLFR